MVQHAGPMTDHAAVDDAPKGAAGENQTAPPYCYRWPDKRVYATADEASVALRRIAAARGDRHDLQLTAYPCEDGHYHHGRLPVRVGTLPSPEERRQARARRWAPGRAVRAAIFRPRKGSPGLPRRG